MSFAKEGHPFIGTAFLLAALAWATWGITGGLLAATIAALFSGLFGFVAWFFRDPDRTDPGGEHDVVAPGDGKVIEVVETEEPTVLGGAARRISIFLSVFNVHVQRSPVGGEVVHRDYHSGSYAVAWHPKASEENERASVGIRTPSGSVLVRQIAGYVARRIVTYPNEGDTLQRGDRIGIIRFGSRVDLFLPLDWEVTCKPGDRVAGGRSVMARTCRASTVTEVKEGS